MRRLERTIRVGRLIVRRSRQPDQVFGALDPGRPELDVTIRLHDRRTEWGIALHPELYLGEAYMYGRLEIERGTLRDFLEVLFVNFRGARSDARRSGPARLAYRILRAVQQRNSLSRARSNAVHHYDLSDELYSRFLDEDRQYSCAYFASPGISLEAAQVAKKEHIIAKLLLRPDQRVLDIGCGWGGLALSVAKQGVGQVTGVTLSAEQLAVARARAIAAKLDHRVRFERTDYRELDGTFDRIVSVGMFEHVGAPYYQQFFDKLAKLLADDGVALLHSIARKEGPGSTNAWTRKYIFPGGYVPALSEVFPAIERAGLWVTDVEILRLHYAETLRHWLARFADHRAAIAERYDETFYRMWDFYLAASEMSFRHDGLMVAQIQLSKRIDAVPITRNYMTQPAPPQPEMAAPRFAACRQNPSRFADDGPLRAVHELARWTS